MPLPVDPSAAADDESGLFGLPHAPEEAEVHVVPIPFDATTSYRAGASRGPQAVLEASRQIDLFDLLTGKPYERGIALLDERPEIVELDRAARASVEAARSTGGNFAEEVNRAGERVNELVRSECGAILDAKKLPVALGGDHSIAFGAIQAASERHPGLGVLQFDAHADLRNAYEGFEHSHASIIHNVLHETDVARVVQVGIRDLCEEEYECIRGSAARVHTLFDHEWAQAKLGGRNLATLVRETIAYLPEDVYITFDVDGLDPTLCPNTGTPVPGGFTWHETMLWLTELIRSKKRIVGLDLNEVNPGDTAGSIDAIVGARLLYRLIGTALAGRD